MKYKFNKRQTNNNLDVKIRNYIIRNMSSFRYLELIIQSNRKIDNDVMHRIQAGWIKWRNALRVICDCKTFNKIKGKFY